MLFHFLIDGQTCPETTIEYPDVGADCVALGIADRCRKMSYVNSAYHINYPATFEIWHDGDPSTVGRRTVNSETHPRFYIQGQEEIDLCKAIRKLDKERLAEKTKIHEAEYRIRNLEQDLAVLRKVQKKERSTT